MLSSQNIPSRLLEGVHFGVLRIGKTTTSHSSLVFLSQMA